LSIGVVHPSITRGYRLSFDDAFDIDDFTSINERFLAAARRQGPAVADPSGWQHTVWQGWELLPPLALATERLHQYQSDTSRGLALFKNRMLPTLRAWDNYNYDYDEITLCSSVTMAALVTLALLKRRGVTTVIFETPTYYATVEQARALELRAVLVPTYLREQFDFRRGHEILGTITENTALWLCQPRPALGWDQNPALISSLLRHLAPGSFLVLDEATEQRWPSRLASLTLADPRIIRLRSLVKGIGVNGLRLAFIAHAESQRRALLELVEIFQGGLDYESLQLTTKLLAESDVFRSLLAAAHDQVLSLYRVLAAELLSTNLSLSRIQNGYIGSVALPRPPALSWSRFRDDLLDYCVASNCPVMLGASMYFAHDDDFEFVRINYYNDPSRVLAGLRILARLPWSQEV
jgi:DNA-binding transcriptional MocR family regulator